MPTWVIHTCTQEMVLVLRYPLICLLMAVISSERDVLTIWTAGAAPLTYTKMIQWHGAMRCKSKVIKQVEGEFSSGRWVLDCKQ